MEKEEMVAARLSGSLLADLKRIQRIEQAGRSTVLRKMIHRAVAEWKEEHAARLYAENKITLERASMSSGISVREMWNT